MISFSCILKLSHLQSYQYDLFIFYLTHCMINNQKQQSELKRLEEIRQRVRAENLKPQYKQKSQSDQNFILQCLKDHFIFYNLSDEELNNVRDSMWYCRVGAAETVFETGSPGSCFFILVNGIVDIEVDNQIVKQLKVGEGFGELALLYDIERPSTVKARQNCSFWVIDKISFRDSVEEIIIKEFEDTQRYLQGVAFYQFLDNRQKEKIASSFVTLKYYKGQNIVEEGDPGSSFYIIKEGVASLIRGNIEERKIYKGQSFGLNSLYYNTIRKMTVRAEQEVICQVLGRQTLAKIVGQENFKESMFQNYAKFVLQKNCQLFSLIKSNEEKFFENMRARYYKTNEIVFKKGSVVHKLIVILEGRIKKFRSANFLAQTGQYWGDQYLNLSGAQNNPFNKESKLEDDIIVETESVLIEISLDSIRNSSIHKKEQRQQIKKVQQQRVQLDKLVMKKTLGKNDVSSVYLFQSDQGYVVGKIYPKGLIQKEDYSNILSQQIEVIEMVSHPFIPKYHQVASDKKYWAIFQDFIKGQSLYEIIREIGILSTTDSQFYIASMILLLEYLSEMQIVVRDLKPDNFIVDQKGYLNLCSLSSSKCIKDKHKTSTVIGTPHYMAPQIILGKEYNELVDLWSVGVMLYEFMLGELPFGAYSQNPYEIYEEVIQGDIVFSRTFKDRRAKKLIETFLSLNPDNRHNGEYSRLKNNSWFESINWNDLNERTVPTPFKPKKIVSVQSSQKSKNWGAFIESFVDF